MLAVEVFVFDNVIFYLQTTKKSFDDFLIDHMCASIICVYYDPKVIVNRYL